LVHFASLTSFSIARPYEFGEDDVLNPKDTVEEAYDNLQGLLPDLRQRLPGIRKGEYSNSVDDLVDALIVPVFMIDEAVEGMHTIAGIGEQIDNQRRKAIIFAFLTAILFFIPIVGKIASAVAGVAAIARIAALIGSLGELALGIYEIVDDPDNAPMAIFTMLLGPLVLGDIAKVTRAASA